MDDLSLLINRIDELLEAPGASRSSVEHTLTDGYAHALSLEAERWRLQRRIAEIGAQRSGEGVGELLGLARRLATADRDLIRLRALLELLRNQVLQTEAVG